MPIENASHISTIADSIASGLQAIRGSTREQRGIAAAAALTFFGVAYLGPALTRLTTPKTRAQRLRDEAAFQAESFRRTARKSSARVRKQARRLGGGPRCAR